MEFPVEPGADIEWWDEMTTRKTRNWCPECEPDLDDVMLDVFYCFRHLPQITDDPSIVDRVTAPHVTPLFAGEGCG